MGFDFTEAEVDFLRDLVLKSDGGGSCPSFPFTAKYARKSSLLRKLDCAAFSLSFLRVGDWASDERSTIHRGDAVLGEEIGVSVYEVFRKDGMFYFVTPLSEAYACDVHSVLSCDKDSRKYIVTGAVVGRGMDNEPLLRVLLLCLIHSLQTSLFVMLTFFQSFSDVYNSSRAA